MKRDYITHWVVGALIALTTFAFVAPQFIQAQVALRVTTVPQGGTGASTTPNVGDILIATTNAFGDKIYVPRATSTLGFGAGSNWSFTGSYLTPSTTVGIGVFASSTIGGGTGATGLTISGGATTTVNFRVIGNTTLATTTTSILNSIIVVDGVRYAKNGSGIQQAINDCDALGGGQVFLPSGLYFATTTISFPFDAKCHLVGSKFVKTNAVTNGNGAEIRATASMTNLVEIVGNYANTNADLSHDNGFAWLYLNGNNNVTNTLYLKNVDFVEMDHIRITGGINGIITAYDGVVPPTSSSVPGAIKIFASSIAARDNMGGTVIDLQTQTQNWIVGSWLSGTASTSIKVASTTVTKFIGNEIRSSDVLVALSDSADASTNNITFQGNTFICGDTGVAFTDTRTNSFSQGVSTIGNSYVNCESSDSIFNGGEIVTQPFSAFENDNISFLLSGTSNVGIGTNTPSYTLEVIDPGGNPTFTLTDDPGRFQGGADPAGRFIFQNAQDTLRVFRGTLGIAASEIHRYSQNLDTSHAIGISNRTLGVFDDETLTYFSTSTSWINNGGNFGIGTTSPYAKLSISAKPSDTTRTLFAIASSTSSGTSTHIAVLNSGRLGVGTDSPLNPVFITGTSNSLTNSSLAQGVSPANTALVIRNSIASNQGVGMGFDISTAASSNLTAAIGGYRTGSNGQGGLYMAYQPNTSGGTVATVGAVLSPAGLFGIGTTTPLANLQVTASSSNATTSVQFGKSGQNKGTCQTFYDTAGTPVYAYIPAGTTAFTLTNTQPSGCQN